MRFTCISNCVLIMLVMASIPAVQPSFPLIKALVELKCEKYTAQQWNVVLLTYVTEHPSSVFNLK